MITVFGSLNVDYVFQVAHLPTPGETVLATDMVMLPGGKGGNQALAAAKAGAEVRMVGAVGEDGLRDIVLTGLQAAGVDTQRVKTSTRSTGTAAINVDNHGENAIVVHSGANYDVSAVQLTCEILQPGSLLLMQMELPLSVMATAVRIAAKAKASIIWNLAPMQPIELDLLQQIDYLIVNEVELTQLVSYLGGDPATDTATQARYAAGKSKARIIVTLGARGCLAINGDQQISVPALPLEPIDTVGAGDAFAGAFSAALASAKSLDQAIVWGCVAGGLACLQTGAQSALPSASQITERVPELTATSN